VDDEPVANYTEQNHASAVLKGLNFDGLRKTSAVMSLNSDSWCEWQSKLAGNKEPAKAGLPTS